MNKQFFVANWKMNKNILEAKYYITELESVLVQKPTPAEVIVFPPAMLLPAVSAVSHSSMQFGIQNFYPEMSGSFTGETSLRMLDGIDCTWVMIGHSERRIILGEKEPFLLKKLQYALESGYSIIFCIGENSIEKQERRTTQVLEEQLSILEKVSFGKDMGTFVIAYEPVWAIGSGNTPTDTEIHTALTAIQNYIGKKLAYCTKKVYTLYGGSVSAGNATDILAIEHVDGLLIGSASLDVHSFLDIIQR